MARERVLLTLTPGLLARVDAARGEEPRVRWIERAIEGALPVSAIERERLRREAFARAASRPPKRS